MWSDAAGRRNRRAVSELLGRLRCDVVALNEVPRHGRRLATLARELGLHHAFADAGPIGNALLSRRPLENVRVVSLGHGFAEPRSALIATVATASGPIDVACTHLDASREPERIAQLDDLLGALASRAPAHLIVGDFNALRLSDYRPEALRAVRAMRKLSAVEAPTGKLIARLDRAGYIDCYRFARAGSLARYARQLGSPLPDDQLPTCWAGTRIDFIWASRAALATLSPTRCWRIDSDASDHVPVVAEFARRP